MSPKNALSILVSTRSTRFWSLTNPMTGALFWPMKVSTLYFLPPMVCCLTVALFADAALRKPCGIIQISSCCTQGVLALTTIV